jgi:hypothetical protein
MYAARSANLDGARLLLDDGIDVNARDYATHKTALWYAEKSPRDRRAPIVELLKARGAKD